MTPIEPTVVMQRLQALAGRDLYVHLETTTGAYTKGAFGAFLRNGRIRFLDGRVTGRGPFRVGLRLADGWLYAEGLTHWDVDEDGRLLLAGHDDEGRLTVALELSPEPFPAAWGAGPALGVGAAQGARALEPGAHGAGGAEALERRVPGAGGAEAALVRGPLVVVLAHPDDESFACGGVMALHAAAGAPVTYVCATRGEMGRNMGRPPLATRETLASLRERELVAACAALGVHDVRFLGLWDKTVEFVDREALVEAVRAILLEMEPVRLITFHPRFGGHPDHEAVGAAALEAVRRLPAERRPVVWCPIVPAAEGDAGLPVETVDIRAVGERKMAALRAHRSQTANWEARAEADPELRARMERMRSEERFWVYAVE
ncbi:MAG: bacillithiol biosynthesis deacetylase BshB2 [Firmicutes bacterium]|nr:bacillithiol biosynthesis deacetylase BshB2 [Bacillota bacterium]